MRSIDLGALANFAEGKPERVTHLIARCSWCAGGCRLCAARSLSPSGARLSDGHLTGHVPACVPGDDIRMERTGEVVVCPWHGWEFDVQTGRSLCDPQKTRVRSYVTRVEHGRVFVKWINEQEMSIDGGAYTAIRSAQRGDLIASTLVRPSFDLMEARRRLVWCRNSDCAWYLYWEESDVLGWVLVSWQGKETAPKYPDLFDLYVRQDSRGRGIGTQLVYFCEEMASKWGFKKIGLAVNHTANPRALALYQRLGYRVIDTRALFGWSMRRRRGLGGGHGKGARVERAAECGLSYGDARDQRVEPAFGVPHTPVCHAIGVAWVPAQPRRWVGQK